MEGNIEVKSQLVEIKVAFVGGRKMTKAVFNQIQEEIPFDKGYNFTGDKCLGYVVIGSDKYMLWTIGGELRKLNFTGFYEEKFLGKWTQMHFIRPTDKNQENQDKMDEFHSSHLKGNQLYIAT